MTDPREELQDIQERADQATGCPTSENDVPRLVAALRAVLDTIDRQGEYTCETSWLVGQIRNAITQALGGNDGS